MRVVVEGVRKDGSKVTRTWNLLDRCDEETSITSMARTTGYTCTAGVRMLMQGLWRETGIHPPEDVGMDGKCFDFVINELEMRNVKFSTEGY